MRKGIPTDGLEGMVLGSGPFLGIVSACIMLMAIPACAALFYVVVGFLYEAQADAMRRQEGLDWLLSQSYPPDEATSFANR
jgi:hypothetical protein